MAAANVARRTHQKVRRNSRLVGSVEAQIWKPTSPKQMKASLEAAERFELQNKAKGRRNGPLGYVALRIYRALWRRVRFSDGTLCPSYDWLMKACRLSRAAVAAGLRRLRAHGFLTWVRRLEYTGGPPGVRGPQVRQVTNAYALTAPATALQLVAKAAVVPDDEITRLAERSAFLRECERAAFDASKLGAAVAALGRAVARRSLTPNASLPSARNPALRSI